LEDERGNKMRKIIAALQTSVDGFIEGPNGELDWAMAEDEETWQDIFETFASVTPAFWAE
jgi:dihydrofolate reductase